MRGYLKFCHEELPPSRSLHELISRTVNIQRKTGPIAAHCPFCRELGESLSVSCACSECAGTVNASPTVTGEAVDVAVDVPECELPGTWECHACGLGGAAAAWLELLAAFPHLVKAEDRNKRAPIEYGVVLSFRARVKRKDAMRRTAALKRAESQGAQTPGRGGEPGGEV